MDDAVVQCNYQQIKQDVQDIVESEMEGILNDPVRMNLVISK